MKPLSSIILLLTLAWAPFGNGEEPSELSRELERIEGELAALPRIIPSLQAHERIGFHGHAADPAWIRIDFGRRVTPDQVAIFPARLPISNELPSTGFPSALQVEISDSPDFSHSVRIAWWAESEVDAGQKLPFLIVPGNGASGQFLRVLVTGFRRDPLRPEDEAFFRLGEIVVLEGGRNVALKRLPVTTASTESPRRWEAHNLTDGYLWCLPLRGLPGSPSNGYQSAIVNVELVETEKWVEVDLGTPRDIDEIHLVPAHPSDFPDSAGFGFPPRFLVHADLGLPTEQELLREVDPPFPAEALPNPGAAPITIATPGLRAQTVRLTCESLWRRGPGLNQRSDYLFALSELQIWSGGQNLAKEKTVRFANATDEGNWSPSALVDGYSSREALLDWETWIEQIARVALLEARVAQIRETMQLRRERVAERWRDFALMSILSMALLGALAIIVFRVRAIRAREALRSRIARDLHDEIGASLSHLAIQTHLAGQQLPAGGDQRRRLDAISQTARETFDNMRDIVWMLAPSGGTWAEFSHRAESIAKRLLAGISSQVTVSGQPPPGDPPIEWARSVVAILKEALANARRHSQAQRIEVALRWQSDRFTLDLSDDGQGFDPADPEANSGQGLRNIQQRATSLRADLQLTSSPGKGTQIHLDVPIPKSAFATKRRSAS